MAIHGKGGNLIYDSSSVVNLKSYTMSRVGETANATAMGDTWEAFIVGLNDFTGSAEALATQGLDTTALMGAGSTIKFSTAAGGAGYSSNVIVTGITETATIDDVITVSYSYEGNDMLGLAYSSTSGSGAAGSLNSLHGKSIRAEYGAVPTSFTDITGWSITMTSSVADATVADASDFGRVKIAGTLTATATVTILTPASDLPVLEGVSGALNLWREGTTIGFGKYTGTAINTGSETGVDSTGVETTTLSFTYTSTVDLAVA